MIKAKLDDEGKAIIAIPGGNTPKLIWPKIFEKGHDIDWERLTMVLTDERQVAPGNKHSNTGSTEQIFNEYQIPINWAVKWKYHHEFKRWCDLNLLAFNHFIDSCNSLGLVWLGMGIDGHVASLFPKDKGKKTEVLNDVVVATEINDALNRISLSNLFLKKADGIILTFSGKDKLDVIKSSRLGQMPVDEFINLDRTKIVAHA
jgi:6-phosphogluconolactonase